MKQLLLSFCLCGLIMPNLLLGGYTEKIYVYKGWNLKGTTTDIKDMDDFLDQDIASDVHVYRNGSFIKNPTSINANEGFWIYGDRSGTLSFKSDGSSSTDDDAKDDIPTFSRTKSRAFWDSYVDRWYNDRWYDSNKNCSWWDNGIDWVGWWNDGYNDSCDDNSNIKASDIHMELEEGWNLRGSSINFRIRDIFDDKCITNTKSISLYSGSNFYKYDKDSSKYIRGDSGFWVHAKENCTLKGIKPPNND